MSANEIVVGHLRGALDELRRQRSELDRTIADVERMLRDYATTSDVAGTARADVGEVATPATARPPIMSDAILEILASEDREFQTSEIVKTLTNNYLWAAASVRSALVRLAKDDEIFKAGRGWYSRKSPGHPGDAEAPGATGASESNTTHLAELGGEETHAQTELASEHHDQPERDDRDRMGTPVGVAP